MGRWIAELSADEKSEICRRYLAGERLSRIAPDFGVSEGLVSDIAKAAGIPSRHIRASRAFEGCTLDISKLKAEFLDGEARVVDTVLGEALGYKEPREIRQLIQKHIPHLEEHGKTRQRATSWTSGRHRIKRKTKEYLLNRGQVNYLITRCGLPKADDWCVHITKVFTAWQEGDLKAVDLDTAVNLQDAAEAAAKAVPELAQLSDEMICFQKILKTETENLATRQQLKETTENLATRQQLEETTENLATRQQLEEKFEDLKNNIYKLLIGFEKKLRLKDRNSFKTADIRDALYVLSKDPYDGRCPSCKKARILLPDGKFVGNLDHWDNNQLNNRRENMLPTCVPCNQGYRLQTIPRDGEYLERFKIFQGILKNYSPGSDQSVWDF